MYTTQRFNGWRSINEYIRISIFIALCGTPVWMQPLKIMDFYERKSCGHELVERVGRICNSRGGLKSYPVHGRVRRGIVNECCANKCADHHLYSYCSNGNKHEVQPMQVPLQSTVDNYSEYEVRPEPLALIRTLEFVEEATEASAVKVVETTTERANRHIDSLTLNKILENLDRQHHNDFQVGTVPPEYRIMPVIPSRSRIMY